MSVRVIVCGSAASVAATAATCCAGVTGLCQHHATSRTKPASHQCDPKRQNPGSQSISTVAVRAEAKKRRKAAAARRGGRGRASTGFLEEEDEEEDEENRDPGAPVSEAKVR